MKGRLWDEMRNMAKLELNAKLAELQDKLFKLKFRHSTATIRNPLKIREVRRTMARIKMLLAQRKESK